MASLLSSGPSTSFKNALSRTAVYVREVSIARVYTATLIVSVKAELALLQLKLGPSKMLTR